MQVGVRTYVLIGVTSTVLQFDHTQDLEMASRFVVLTAVCISLISLTGGDNKNAIPSVKILVVGKTGHGKSTLVNGLFGSEKAEAGHRLKPKTKDVECFVEVYQSEAKRKFKVTICDSPGFRDTSYSDNVYIEKLKSKCHDPDLVLYVVSMKEERWSVDQVETIARVNEALGKEIWNNTMLVLTFANEFKGNSVERKYEFLSEFVESLSNINVKVDKPSVALAGHLPDEHLPQHGIAYWYTQLFVEGATRVKHTGADALMLLILYHKDKVRFTEDMKEVFCKVFNSKTCKFVAHHGVVIIVFFFSKETFCSCSFHNFNGSFAIYMVSYHFC